MDPAEREALCHLIEAAAKKGEVGPAGGYVYVIWGRFKGEVLHKIGQSNNPSQRASQLRQKHPGCGARVRHTILTSDPFKLERALHLIFEPQLGGGPSWEWFRLDTTDLAWLMALEYVDMAGF